VAGLVRRALAQLGRLALGGCAELGRVLLGFLTRGRDLLLELGSLGRRLVRDGRPELGGLAVCRRADEPGVLLRLDADRGCLGGRTVARRRGLAFGGGRERVGMFLGLGTQRRRLRRDDLACVGDLRRSHRSRHRGVRLGVRAHRSELGLDPLTKCGRVGIG
jgi:hypothetical protein